MPTVPFSKPFLSFDAQYNKLTLSIIDKDYVLAELLMHSSYYRIKNYIPPLQAKYQNSLIPVQEVKNLIDFDSTLRTLFFRCIEPIEVYFRSTISEYMLEASHGDSFWYLNTLYFINKRKHASTIQIIEKDFSSSKESFIVNYRHMYTLPTLTTHHSTANNVPPTWMLNEISSFGLFSNIFSNLDRTYKKNIASAFLVDEYVLSSWILSLHTIRNTCAHHARLWNKRLGIAPKIPNNNPFAIQCDNRKIAIIIQILIRLLTVIHGHNNSYTSQLKEIAVDASPFIQCGMGFTQPLTKNSFQ
ncbi:MAG: Abi family protein [Pseudomonadota bacterium]